MNNQEKSWIKKVSNVAKTAVLGAMIAMPKEGDAQSHHVQHQDNQNPSANINYENQLKYHQTVAAGQESHHSYVNEQVSSHTYHPGDNFEIKGVLAPESAWNLANELVNNSAKHNLSKHVTNAIETHRGGEHKVIFINWVESSEGARWDVQEVHQDDIPENYKVRSDIVCWNISADQK